MTDEPKSVLAAIKAAKAAVPGMAQAFRDQDVKAFCEREAELIHALSYAQVLCEQAAKLAELVGAELDHIKS